MAKYSVAPSAQADLEDIWRYISEHNEDAATTFIQQIAKQFELLADNNLIGRRQFDFVVDMRMFPFKKYNIYYFPIENGIEIYRIIHSSRDVPVVFDDMLPSDSIN